MKNNDKWSALSMSERADLIKLYVSNGVTSLNELVDKPLLVKSSNASYIELSIPEKSRSPSKD